MKKNVFKIFIIVLFLMANLSVINYAYAASMKLDFSKKVAGAGEQFYVDLMLDTEGQSINAVEGSITFQDENISFVRYEEGKSMINLWVKKPTFDDDRNTLSFAGIITNGFSGVIDPFNPNYKLPGPIIRLVFEGEKPGSSSFSTSTFNLNLNDGLGTKITAPPFYGSIIIGDFVNNQKYENKTDSILSLDTYVIRDPNIYNNKYVLIFKATDKGVGIKDVAIKEGRKDWVIAESPYLLKDQSRRNTIYVQATNNDGTSIIKTIEPLPHSHKLLYISIFVALPIILFVIIIIIIYKKHRNKND